MKNARNNNIRMAKRNQIGKNIFRATALLAIFMFVFAFVCIVTDVNFVSQIENGTLDNVASAWKAPGYDNNFTSATNQTTIGSPSPSSTGNSMSITKNSNSAGNFTAYASKGSNPTDGNYEHTTNRTNGTLLMFQTYKLSDANLVQAINLGKVTFSLTMNVTYGTGNITSKVKVVFHPFISIGTANSDSDAMSVASGSTYTQVAETHTDKDSGETWYGTSTEDFSPSNVTPYSSSTGTASVFYLRVGLSAYTQWNGGGFLQSDPKLQCKINSYTVTLTLSSISVSFASNNTSKGTVSPTSGSISTFGGTVSSTGTEKSGYHFSNWTGFKGTPSYSNSNKTITVSYQHLNSKTPTITANFENNTGTINYNANGGSVASGQSTTQTITYGTAIPIRDKTGFSKTGFTIIGWSTSNAESAVVEYEFNESVTNNKIEGVGITSGGNTTNNLLDLSSTNGGSITLYAVWVESDYDVLSGHSKTDGTWGSNSNPFVINTAKQLQNLALIVSNQYTPLDSITGISRIAGTTTNAANGDRTYAGCYFIVNANIDMSTTYAGTFIPIGTTSSLCFSGNFTGNNTSTLYTITLAMTRTANYCGLFGYVKGTSSSHASISYIKIAGSVSDAGYDYVGGVVGYAEYTDITSCDNAATVSGKKFVGGVVGQLAYSYKVDSTTYYYDNLFNGSFSNSGAITGTGQYVGGIAGYLGGHHSTYGNSTITSATNSGNVSSSGQHNVAGIAGYAAGIEIHEGTNTGNITGKNYTAGIFGQTGSKVVNLTGNFINGQSGTTKGKITGTGSQCGGILGNSSGYLRANSAFKNYGAVAGTDGVGGLFGYVTRIEATIILQNYGAVTGTTAVGGIAGRMNGQLKGTSSNKITNSGTITSKGGTRSAEVETGLTAVGGIVGYTSSNVIYATNSGTITTSSGKTASGVGGIAGTYRTPYTNTSTGAVTTYNITFENCTNSGSITSGGDYTGGIVGRLYTTATKNFKACSNSGAISGASYVGGIAGSLEGYTITSSCTNTGSVTGSGSYIGGFIGDAVLLTLSVNLTNAQQISGASYVGGIFGHVDSTSNLGSGSSRTLNNSGTILGSTSYVGGIIGKNDTTIAITVVNSGSVYGYSSSSTSTKTAKYVGGLFGANTANISSMIITSIQASSSSSITVTGAGYVGAICGATYGSRIAINTSSTPIRANVYGGGDSSHNYGYCGGLFGYVAGTGAETTNSALDPGTSTNNYIRFTTSTLYTTFTFSGYGNYVGKIAGYATGVSIENLSANPNTDSESVLTNTTAISSTNGICVGGIVGYLASCAIHQEIFEPLVDVVPSSYGYASQVTVSSTGTAVEPSKVYKYSLTYTKHSSEGDYNVTSVLYFAPTFVGTITTLPTYNESTDSFSNFVITETNEFITSIGGVTPNTYLGTSIYGRYANTATITASMYVGGIIGKIDSGVGNLASGTRGESASVYYLGGTQLLYLENSGAINASTTSMNYFVGGVIGALINNTSTNGTNYITHCYANLVNRASIGSASYSNFIGGLIGSVGNANDIVHNRHLVAAGISGADENSTLSVVSGSYNGDRSTVNTISGYYYVGGAVGFFGANASNYVENFVNTATINGGSYGYYIGGIAGYMAGGRSAGNGYAISKSLSAPTANVSSSTSFYVGYQFVGGIVGQAGNISIDNCYCLGFKASTVQSDKGGIAGNALATTVITNSWAVLLASGLTYEGTYSNPNGNFILVGAETDWCVPNFQEMLVEVGLRTTLSGSVYSSSTHTAAQVGYITLKLHIPGTASANESNNKYIAFFNGNGTREPSVNIYRDYSQSIGEYAGYIDDTANTLYVKTYLAQASSYSVCKETASFVNVESTESSAYTGLSEAKRIANWIEGFNNGRFSDEYIIEISSAPTLSSNIFTVKGNVFYKNLRTGHVDDKWLVGVINTTYTNGTSTLPYTISNADQWRTFAGYVRANNSTYNAAYWKVLKDIDLGTYSSSNNFFVGDINTQSGTAFSGTLDGNGKTVTYNYSNTSSEVSTVALFPRLNANAKIMNLYVAGTINATSGREIGGIVGWCNYNITIENCRSSMSITASRNVGGIIGYIKGTSTTSITATLRNVVNMGTVTCTNNRANVGGVGGIIGAIQRCDNDNTNSAVIDSASNKGAVYGDINMGGIVGYTNGTCTISNNCNTGTVQSNYWSLNLWCYCGGIVGHVTTKGNINVYASYNSGTVHGYGNRVGGILGSDADSNSDTAGKTNIYYCFNSGNVISGHPSHTNETSNFNKNNKVNSESSGAEVGGLVGMAISINMNYCYNIGSITCYGVLYHCGEYQARAGGLIGLAYDYQHNNYSNMRYCYNAGIVYIRTTSKNSLYASGLIGAMIYERGGIYTIADALKYWSGANNLATGAQLTGNYSLHGQVDLGVANSTGPEYNNDKVPYVFDMGLIHPTIELEHNMAFANGSRHVDAVWWAQRWTYEDTITNASAMVCGVDSNGLGTRPSGMSDWSSGGTNGSTAVLRTNNAITNGGYFGYIYLPGCLPQLSIFATDTETSVAMTGFTSGFNTERQTYELQSAGTEYSPYVIQNGIDLLGLTQLIGIDANYHADGKYYAFANGYNNLDYNALVSLDMNTLNVTGMTQTSYTSYTYSTTTKSYVGYEFPICNNPMVSTGSHSFYTASGGVGKNIRLLRIANNNYLNGDSSQGRNFCQIGTTSAKYFAGTLEGYKTLVNGVEVSYPVINNLKIRRTANNDTGEIYAGFVGYGRGCTIRNFTIDNSTITVTGGTSSSYAAPFLAKAINDVNVSGLVSGVNTTVTVSSVNSRAYAGGIVAYADPNNVTGGSNITNISDCTSNASVSIGTTGTLNYVGGILGYANQQSTRTDVAIYIEDCRVQGGTLSNASTNTGSIGTGGILGYRSLIGNVVIRECEVGTGSNNVIIEGEHTVGGVTSRTTSSANTYITTIQNCTIGNKTTIRKKTTTTVNTTHKTAFGGFVGYSENCLMTGTNTFSGNIKIGTASAYVAGENIGGMIGYMGPNTTIQGNVNVDGSIDSGSTAVSKNIGGAIGYVPSGTNNIDGQFYINPTMTTTKSQYVGGFIGYNAGNLYILGSSDIIDATGSSSSTSESQAAVDNFAIATAGGANTITADLYVGGFIGYNNGTLRVGSQKDSGDQDSIGTFTATLVANVNGTRYVGGFVGYNNGTITTVGCKANVTNAGDICNAEAYKTSTEIGGIVGYNAASASFAVSEQENYFANSGTIGYNTASSTVQYAGGVVGYNAGSFTNVGTLANTGAIYGNQYVAGSIGYFQSGALYGTMINGVAHTSTNGDTVSRSYSTTTTRFAASTTTLPNPTTITLEKTITEGVNYTYSIGKVAYYFKAPIGGTVKGFENNFVIVRGKQQLYTSTALIDNTHNVSVNSTVIQPGTVYNYTDTNKYYFSSTVYGMVKTLNGHTMTFYPTLEATDIGTTSGYTSISAGGSVNKSKYFISGTQLVFDASDLIGTVAYVNTTDGGVAFSSLKIEASREPLTGTMTASEGGRITKGNKYKFYVGTVPYFFEAKVTGKVESIVGNVLTIGTFDEEGWGYIQNTGAEVQKNHYYVLNNGSEKYFYATVDGTVMNLNGQISSVGDAVEVDTTLTAEKSAIASPTDLSLSIQVNAGSNYTYTCNGTTYYFTAPYTGNLTYLSNNTYGITNTDYTDMIASTKDADSHSGYVSGVTNIGGVVSVVNQATTVGVYKENGNFVPGVYTRLINFGTVQSTSGENVGGSIGSMAGTIAGETVNTVTQYVEFFNYGTVNVVKNGGGCIGIYSGNGTLVKMFNYQNTNIYDAAGNTLYENIGGCIGVVRKPASGYAVLTEAIIVNSGVVRAYTTRTGVTGTGFGGVIGTIEDSSVQSQANWSVDLYSDGSVYCGTQANGQSNAGQFSRVGGLIGAIGSPTGAGAPIILKSVLNYTKRSGGGSTSTVTAVSGYDYVGGILGLNNSSVTAEGENASVRYCYNVGGEVWGHYSSGTIGGIVGKEGSNSPNTYCCYWISAFENSALQNAKVNSLGSTLTRAWTTAFSAQDVTNGVYAPETWEEYFAVLKAFLGNGGVSSGYFTDGVDDYYLENYTYENAILDENENITGYSYIDYYDIFFTNTYTDIREAAQNRYNDFFSAGLDITTITTDTDIPVITTIHDVNSATQSIREKGEAEFEDLQEVVVAYLDPGSTHTFETNDIGDYGFYENASEGTKSYSTGNVKTGFFFAYAHDDLPKYSDREIETEHTRNGAPADYDLRMWKYISQAYGNTETNNSTSYIIYNYNPSTTDSSGYQDKSGSSAELYHIYARAYMPTISGNPTGYFLFAQAQVSSGLKVSYNAVEGSEAFYIDANSAECQNVLVFYKQVAVTTKLTYNGLQRSAPIAGLTATESKIAQKSYYVLNDHAPYNGVTFNTGTDVGIYYLDTSIYYIPDNAYIFSVGSGNTGTQINVSTLESAQSTKLIPGQSYYYTIDATSYTFTIPNSITFPNTNATYNKGYGWLKSLPTASSQKLFVVCPVAVGQAVSNTSVTPVTYTWKISERKLSVIAVNKAKTSGTQAIEYDKESHSVTITISNVVSADTTLGTYTTENALKALNMYFKLTFNPAIAAANTNEWICKIQTPSQNANVSSSRGYSTKDGGYCTGDYQYQVVNYVYTLSAINAGTYTITAEKDNTATKANNYALTTTTAKLVINKKALTASWTGNEAIDFDGNNHTLTLQISGWAVGETVGTTGTSGTVLNWVNSTTFTATSGLSKGTIACSGQSSGKTTASSVVSIPYTTKNIGTYNIRWSVVNLGPNYTLAAGQTDNMSIAAMTLIATKISEWGTTTYDGTDNHEYKVRITTSNPDKVVASTLITEIFGKVSGNYTYTLGATGGTYSKESGSNTKVTITVTFKAKHAGNYKFGINSISEANGNYAMTAFTGGQQIIEQRALTISGKNISNETFNSGVYNFVYNQSKQGLGSVVIGNFANSTDATTVLTSGMNNNTTNIILNQSSSGTTITYTCGVANVGNYYVGIGLKSSNSTSSNYTLTSGTWTWNITNLNIRCTWSEIDSYVYNGTSRTRQLASIAIYNGDSVVEGLEAITPSSTNGNLQTFHVNITGTYQDAITLTLNSTEAINVGAGYACSVSSFTLTGDNAEGTNASIASNYSLTSSNTTFSIVKSKVFINTSNGTIVTKEYDHTTDLPNINITDSVIITFASSNGGSATPGYTVVTGEYDTANVGVDKNITYTIALGNSTNYEWRTPGVDKYVTISNGEITKKQLQIVLFKRGANITKVYDNNAYFGGASGAVYSSGTTARSSVYRNGNGFELRNIVSSEDASSIAVVGVFQEIDRSRSAFDHYINNVINDNGTYRELTATELLDPTITKYYKQLVFTMSGTSSGNYSLAIMDGSSILSTSNTSTITYADNKDASIHINITKYTINVLYGNTYQSYAQSKNEYTYENVGWEAVTAQLPTNSNISNTLTIAVVNNWMYQNHVDMTDGWARIVKYTRQTGRAGTTLVATLGGPNGIALNYSIKAQPVLVIDYFVNDGDSYEITTLAGLLLATYYYKNFATLGDDDKVYTYEWIQACNDAGYDSYMADHPTAELEYDPATGYWGYWNATEVIADKYDKFILNADISGIMTESDYTILKNAFGVDGSGTPLWGYGMGHTINEVYVTYLNNFMQTNIGEEVTVIGNFFADTFDGTFDGNGYVIKNFTQIYNVTVAAKSEVNIGFFGKTTELAAIMDMSLREYKLYIYDYTGLGNTLNVGALIGASVMSTSVTNTTIHASVNVIVSGNNAIVNAGIMMGRYEGTITGADADGSTEYDIVLAIENAVTLGNIEVDNASGSSLVGGILGSIDAYNNNGRSIFNSEAFADINVTSTINMVGGIIGYAGDDTSISSTLLPASPNSFNYLNSYGVIVYLANSAAYRTSASSEWAISNLAIGNVTNGSPTSSRNFAGTTYTNIMNGSNTAYNTVNMIYRPESTTTKGTFDIISEVTAGSEPKYRSYLPVASGVASTEPRESRRLSDILKVYVLKLDINETTTSATIQSELVTLRVYTIASSNIMLGSALGTTSSKIKLSYAQHITILRMFRFAEFELTKQINLPVNNYNIVYSGVFYGNITRTTVQVISTSGYTTRKIGSKTYTTLDSYVAAYESYYNVTLTTSGGYYVYTPSIYVYNNNDGRNKMFEKEINQIPIDGVVAAN